MTSKQRESRGLLTHQNPKSHEPVILFYPLLADAFGVGASLLLQQIHYWCRDKKSPVREGHHWCYRTYDQWSKQIGILGPEAVRQNVQRLASMGVIKIGVYNKNKYDHTQWYRIDYDMLAQILSARTGKAWQARREPSPSEMPVDVQLTWTSLIEEDSGEDPGESWAPSAPGGIAQEGTEESEVPEGVEEGPAVQVSAMHTIASEAVQPMSLETEMKGGKNLDEVLKGLQLDKTSPPAWEEEVAPTSTKLAAYWRKLVVFYGHASFMHPPTVTEKGQWSYMLKREEERLPAVVELVVRKWDAFSMHVKDAAGLASRPQHPSVDFLTKHLTSAVNWFLMQQSTPASVDSGASKPFVFVAKPTKKPTTISAGPTDWGAVEAEVLKGKDTNHGTGD